MAWSVTVQKIVDGARLLVDDPLGALATDAQCIVLVNKFNARLHSYYVQCEPDRYRTEATITVPTPAVNYSTLPSDWFSTIGIDYVSGTDVQPLSRLQEHERNAYASSSSTRAEKYRITESQVILVPTPVAGQTYRHIYLPTPTEVTALSDSINCRMGHEDYLSMILARRLSKKEEGYDGQWDDEINKIEAELKLEANMRYFNEVGNMTTPDKAYRDMSSWPWTRSRWP